MIVGLKIRKKDGTVDFDTSTGNSRLVSEFQVLVSPGSVTIPGLSTLGKPWTMFYKTTPTKLVTNTPALTIVVNGDVVSWNFTYIGGTSRNPQEVPWSPSDQAEMSRLYMPYTVTVGVS